MPDPDPRSGPAPQPRIQEARWFWEVVRQYRSLYGHVALASLLVNLLSLAMPLFVMNVYDRVVPNHAFESLWVLASGLCLACLTDFALRNARARLVDVAGRNADVLLLGRFMDTLLDIRLDHSPRSTGQLAAQVREFEYLREFFTSTTLLALIDLPFVLLFILLIFWLGGPLALIPLLALPGMALCALLIQWPFRRAAERQVRRSARKNALLMEIAANLETIKAAQLHSSLIRRWDLAVDEDAEASMRARGLGALAAHGMLSANILLNAALVVAGVYRIAAGEMSMGGLVACVILLGRSTGPLTQLARLLSQLHKAGLALQALHRFMLLPREHLCGDGRAESAGHVDAERPTITPPSAPLFTHTNFRVADVFFRYPGQDPHTWALRGCTLRISQGEHVGIVGASGSGKSTLARLCLGLYEPDRGTLFLGDVDLRRLSVRAVRDRIGFLPQDICLFGGTLRENLTMAWPAPPPEEELLRVADLAGVLDFARLHPLGLDMPLGERGAGLSGGQAQAVALARALARNPEILILDEPSSNLDNAAEQRLRNRLRPTLQNRTLLLLTHRLSLLELVDRVIVLDGGRVIRDGPIAAVLKGTP